MFARVKKSGKYQYLQIVENRKVKGKDKQRVIAIIGRMGPVSTQTRPKKKLVLTKNGC